MEKKSFNTKKMLAFLAFIGVGGYFVFRADIIPDAIGWQGIIDDLFVGLGVIALVNKYLLKGQTRR
jgi:uncharacterized membrane protein YkvA (DUF1232 family)